MIEMMLEAERALGVGLLDRADALYRQVVAADPGNSIAIVGLARVALERGDERGAYTNARRALAIDPENPMASHLVMRMAEILERRGEPLPAEPDPGPPAGGQRTSLAAASTQGAAPSRPGLVARLLRRGGGGSTR
jgi:tetratricopeptide repeat protein